NFLGGRLYDDDFCLNHTGELKICTNSVDCSIRSLWQMIQTSVDETLKGLTLKHLITDNLSYFQIAENKGKLNF
ncbi:MAG: transcriptional regulator, partial [Ignavibacteria bacterium]|nr:transcriptional regulator [Ignavibacteria bacterium]